MLDVHICIVIFFGGGVTLGGSLDGLKANAKLSNMFFSEDSFKCN